jgi:outer membrane biosynthesis protein TonB
MNVNKSLTRAVVGLVLFAMCGFPEAMRAQQSTNPPAQQPQQPTNPPGTTVDPSQAPLAPAPTTEQPQPTPETQPAQAPTTVPNGPQPQQQQQQGQREPLGSAAAGGVPTAGGGASRPAGTAIAPAKQHQVRSFLIKLGAIAAAGAAIGTVYALSRGTSSTPPNSGR